MKKILLTLTTLLVWTTGMTCTCDFGGNFIKTSKRVDLVAVVEMKEFSSFVSVDNELINVEKPETVTFIIKKVLKGTEDRDEIRIFGDDGTLCRPSVRGFSKGKYYVVGLHKCKNYKRISGTTPSFDNYSISICGAYWIDYSPIDNKVKGVIDKRRKVTTMRLDKLVKLLKED